MKRRFRRLAVVAAAATAAVTIAACSSSGTNAPSTTSSGPVTLTFWTWLSTTSMQALANEYTKIHPNIKINVVDVGSSAAEYTKLETAIKAGKGAPDVAQVEYFALPQFALTNEVVNLDTLGVESVKSRYTTTAWNSVTVNGGVYGVPQDTGPMAMFYRKDLFKEAGLTPPTTWAQYAADAVIIHDKFPKTYIGNMDPTDPGTATSLMWQAGATPFKTTGTSDVSVNFNEAGVDQYAALWSGLLQKHLVATDPGWTTAWGQALAAGKYATWITGAWATGSLAGYVTKTDEWAVAPIPQWTAGANVDANNGGSSDAVIADSTHKTQALAFDEWINSSATGALALTKIGDFPATSALISSSSFLSQTAAVLGNQANANQILLQASSDVASGWQYLPFQVYANSIYQDTVGQDVASDKAISAGLQSWAQRIVSYGQTEGFTMTTGS
jgi:multiple sugar transport system substrate-binding protein